MGPAFSQDRMPQGQRIWESMLGIVLFRRDEVYRGGSGRLAELNNFDSSV
jgi:hypothetical protein